MIAATASTLAVNASAASVRCRLSTEWETSDAASGAKKVSSAVVPQPHLHEREAIVSRVDAGDVGDGALASGRW